MKVSPVPVCEGVYFILFGWNDDFLNLFFCTTSSVAAFQCLPEFHAEVCYWNAESISSRYHNLFFIEKYIYIEKYILSLGFIFFCFPLLYVCPDYTDGLDKDCDIA